MRRDELVGCVSHSMMFEASGGTFPQNSVVPEREVEKADRGK